MTQQNVMIFMRMINNDPGGRSTKNLLNIKNWIIQHNKHYRRIIKSLLCIRIYTRIKQFQKGNRWVPAHI